MYAGAKRLRWCISYEEKSDKKYHVRGEMGLHKQAQGGRLLQ